MGILTSIMETLGTIAGLAYAVGTPDGAKTVKTVMENLPKGTLDIQTALPGLFVILLTVAVASAIGGLLGKLLDKILDPQNT